MLKDLQIENYALIDKLDIKFNNGFTTITGETGAGKSILLGALSLILGQRADTQVLYNKNKKCIIEGHFDIKNLDLKELFNNNNLDFENPCCFRREINQHGKSRAFINDTPVNLSVMKQIGDKLIDIHSQHQNLLATDKLFQFEVVDNFCDQLSEIKNYKELYKNWKSLLSKNELLKEEERKARSDQDYYNFQLDELDKANLDTDEFDNLETELKILENAEVVKLNFEKSNYLLEESEMSVTTSLNEVEQLLSSIQDVSPAYSEIYERIKSSKIELKDISRDISGLSEKIIFDKNKIQELKDRYDLINQLKLKHNVTSIGELIQLREEYRTKANSLDSLEENIQKNEKKINEIENKLISLAEKISNNRKNAIPGIEKEVTTMLKQLGMPNAQFKIDIKHLNELGSNGKDSLDFLFNANLGGELKEVSKIASGGELSRLMLSIKSLISKKKLLSTIIFDEIDSGISGDIATQMGVILNDMAKTMQVITITHLAQIAARGEEQLQVYKISGQKQTNTRVKQLKGEERILEIATMLGGSNPSEGMIKTAKELILQK